MKILSFLYPAKRLSNKRYFEETGKHQIIVKTVDVFRSTTNKVVGMKI